MNEQDKQEYMSMISQLIRQNNITNIEFTTFMIDEYMQAEHHSEMIKKNLVEAFCNKLKSNLIK